MSSEHNNVFTKENLDQYLGELGKEFRKLNGTSVPAEIILIGGASILANYGFREMTTNVDAVIHASSSMKDAINRVGDKFDLPNGWLNSDFTRTVSYSPKLDEVSVYYRMFSNVLTVRTISAEYLVAMKLRSGRKYKNDLSDIIGILSEHQKKGTPLTEKKVSDAIILLYGSLNEISEEARDFIGNVFKINNLEQLYADCTADEYKTKNMLIGFEQEYPGVTTETNINDIIALLKKRQ